MNMVARRAQTPISFRSDRAAARLKLLTRGGQSQAEIFEKALELMPVPPSPNVTSEEAARRDRIHAILDRFAAAPGLSMTDFDAVEYDGSGNPR